MLDSNCLYVTDENGQEQKMIILFTFDSEDFGSQYVVFQKPDAFDGEIYASRYDDKGNLLPIETDEEWDMVEEVINTFVQDEESVD